MTVSEIRANAEEFGISFKAAAWSRCRYLQTRLKFHREDVQLFEEFLSSEDEWEYPEVLLHKRIESFNAVSAERELQVLTKLVDGFEHKCRITDEQIELAKATPITNVIEFKRGKATAWCHEDRNPSMYHGTRKNVAVCPVCDRKFNAVDVLMDRDGLTFVEAVVQLAA